MPAPDDAQITGTLPLAGQVTVPGAEPAAPRHEPPEWLARTREELAEPGRYLAWELDGRPVVVALDRELTRIGRSLGAEVRFDDATVSRRHAVITVDEAGVRVLDDRSLNGIRVNGRQVESCTLADGDQVLVGRHALYLVDTVAAGAGGAPAAAALAD
jgi:pSer/pThr/pTyr-binding forkhead associated (FHA) protein